MSRARGRAPRRQVLCLLALGAAALGTPDPARAVERVIAFHSAIEVDADGSMTVREEIRVRAEGDRIKRGVYRDFPTDYRGYGLRYRVPFQVLSAERDGAREPYRTERRANGVRVYLGRADVLLKPGVYTYVLAYRTDRQLGFFADHDELYWNVTGTGWEFPFEQVTATVSLPGRIAAQDLRLEGYTGAQGARGRDYTARVNARGQAEFATTAPLLSRHGLTIVVGWPKGIVAKPGTATRLGHLVADNRGLLWGVGGLALLLLYYLFAWVWVGRDPAGGVIVPRFAPPQELSPAAVCYLSRMGFDHTAFAATVIDLAVKRFLTIQQHDGTYTLHREAQADPARLPPVEREVAKALLGERSSLRLEPGNHARVSAGIEALNDQLAREYHRVHFVTNRGWLVPGLALAVLTLVASGLSDASQNASQTAGQTAGFVFMTVWFTMWSFPAFLLWAQRQYLGASVVSAFEVMAVVMLGMLASAAIVVLLAALVGVNVLFYYLLRAPTRSGRALLDAIEGFKRYLSVAEVHRLNVLNPPEETPELFECFLPYALALGVDQQWSERFARVLASRTGEPTYSPDWYCGFSLSSFQPATFGSALGSDLASAIASSSTAPGSSSGGGGGGSSGGGGGGGGGGGW